MSRKNKITGQCKLCRFERELTFEHIPPQSAFNNQKVTEVTFDKLECLDSFDEAVGMKGRVSQRGLGGNYLCAKCNNDTGSWYGASYAKWTKFGSLHLEKKPEQESIEIHPLRVIKQIVSNFVCIQREPLDETYKSLAEFVLDRDKIGLPVVCRIYIAGTRTQIIRKADVALMPTENGLIRFSEIVFPPYVCMLTINSERIDKRLIDISKFASYSYDDEVSLNIQLSELPVNTPFPGDYRLKDKIYSDADNSN